MNLSIKKDLVAGAFFILVGLYFLAGSLHYDFGDLANIGPGNFPLGLSVILLVLGASILVASARSDERVNFGGRALWPIVLVTGALIFFTLTIERGGIVAATFVTVLIASRADRSLPWNRSLLISTIMTLLVVAIFRLGLNIYIPLWPWS